MVSRLRENLQSPQVWQIRNWNEYFCCAGPLSTETLSFPKGNKRSEDFRPSIVSLAGERDFLLIHMLIPCMIR